MTCSLSIVIVTYNSEQTISSCLTALGDALQEVSDAETIIVDNGSTDTTVTTLAKSPIEIRVLKNAVNRGFAVAANQGARASHGKLLLFLNPDCIVRRTTLRDLLVIYQNVNKSSIIGIQLISPDGVRIPSFWKIPTLPRLILDSLLPYKLSLHAMSHTLSKPSIVDSVTGACLLIPRVTFESLGGFDERYFLYYEDVDLCYSARRAGIPVYGVPTIVAVHYVGKSFGTNTEQLFRHLYRGKILFAQKYFSHAQAIIASLLIRLGIGLRAVSYLAAGILGFQRTYQERARIHARLLFYL